MTEKDDALAAKEKGNECFKKENYTEAVLHYALSIKLDPKNYVVYSNRSAAFLRMKQYFLAMEDAVQTIQLKPEWAKGYFRKGEVEEATYNYKDALLSYRCALKLQSNDPTIVDAIKRVSELSFKDKKADEQIPWLGAGVGIVIGVIIVIADQIFTSKPSISHPILMAVLTITIALIGFGFAKGYRYFVDCHRKGLMEPPVDLYNEMKSQGEPEPDEKPQAPHQRHTKAQARYKLRKGKT